MGATDVGVLLFEIPVGQLAWHVTLAYTAIL